MSPFPGPSNGKLPQRHCRMIPFWIKELISKDRTKFLWLNSLDLTGCCNLLVTIRISSLDIAEYILERTFLDHIVLGRLMISALFCGKGVNFVHSFILFRRIWFIHKKLYLNMLY